MPELDYALLCDYVRVDGGVAHIIAAHIDTIIAPQVPAGTNLGVLSRLIFSEAEGGQRFPLQFVFRSDTDRLLQIDVEAEGPTVELPPGWPRVHLVGLNVGVLFPHHGLYALEISLNGELQRTLDFRVVPPA